MSLLRSYLGEVVSEYGRVLSMYGVLMRLNEVCGYGDYVGVVRTALIESIPTHSRNLIQFFKIVRGNHGMPRL